MIDISAAVTALKLPTKIIFSVGTAAGVLLFANEHFLQILGLTQLVTEYRLYIGLSFVVAICIVVTTILSSVVSFVWPWINQALWVRQHRRHLHNLTPEEKEILAFYVDNRTRSQSLPLQSGVVNALQNAKIIVRGSSMGTIHGFDYIIQPWAWGYLNEHPELLN
ncbi:MAG: superinfection exclusion B family protein [Rhizobiales bacterium]|nr:superinfection exclusion B family protein [Hyphomicrobiales bacterium]